MSVKATAALLYAAELSDWRDMACLRSEQWDAFDDVFPEHWGEIVGMYDHTLCILFLREMVRTGDVVLCATPSAGSSKD